MRFLFAITAFASVLLIPYAGSASTLYDTGTDPGVTSPDITVDTGYRGVAFFTLADDSIVDSVSMYLWMNHPNVPVSLDWAIESADSVTLYASGTGTTLTNIFDRVNPRGYDEYHSTFDLTIPLSLDAGNYRLILANCGAGAAGCGWGVANSGGSDLQIQGNTSPVIGTYAYSIQGEVASDAPEPATWMMLGPALIGFAGAAIRKRRA